MTTPTSPATPAEPPMVPLWLHNISEDAIHATFVPWLRTLRFSTEMIDFILARPSDRIAGVMFLMRGDRPVATATFDHDPRKERFLHGIRKDSDLGVWILVGAKLSSQRECILKALYEAMDIHCQSYIDGRTILRDPGGVYATSVLPNNLYLLSHHFALTGLRKNGLFLYKKTYFPKTTIS